MSLLLHRRCVTARGGDLQCLWPLVSHICPPNCSSVDRLTHLRRPIKLMRQRALYPIWCLLPFHAHSPPPPPPSLHDLSFSLCRNGKMECVPEDKGNLLALLLPSVPVLSNNNKALFQAVSLLPQPYAFVACFPRLACTCS